MGSADHAQLTAERPYTVKWAVPSPKKHLPFPTGIWTAIYMVPWAHPSSQPKRHLDQFSHFYRAYCGRPTYSQTTLLGR